jgi:hypothetical protein
MNYVGSAEQLSINEFHELLQLLLAIRHFYQQQNPRHFPAVWPIVDSEFIA